MDEPWCQLYRQCTLATTFGRITAEHLREACSKTGFHAPRVRGPRQTRVDSQWKHRKVLASRLVPNGPTLNNKPTPRGTTTSSEQSTAVTTIQTTINPHPHTRKQRGTKEHIDLWWSCIMGETPSNIPNLAGLGSTNGTANRGCGEQDTATTHQIRG